MILAQTELSIIGLIVQGGFAALCGYMVWSQERKAKRDEERQDRQRAEWNRAFGEKDKYIRELVESNRDLLLKSIQAQERSTEVSKQVVDVIKRCARENGKLP
ncbi:MAG TPA: hypothetical protein PLF81_25525 [Candidatus Anammoximicrobium sp.]|nr:hypothetical protein [Candidatus Anammoximicrobium sp.]